MYLPRSKIRVHELKDSEPAVVPLRWTETTCLTMSPHNPKLVIGIRFFEDINFSFY